MLVRIDGEFKPGRFWLRWVTANAWAELAGLGCVAALGYAIARRFGEPAGWAPATALAVIMVALGAIEGLIVGFAQSRLLRSALPEVSGWVLATVTGAVASWTLGMVPSTVMSATPQPDAAPPQINEALRLLLAAGLGFAAGPLLAIFQWRRLRGHVARAWLWLPANGLAWAAGMPVIFYAAHLVAGLSDAVAVVCIVAAALLLAGALVGAIHGALLVRLVLQPRASTA